MSDYAGKKSIRVLQVIGHMNRGGAETMIMNLYRNVDRNRVQFDFVEHSRETAAFDDEILSLGGKIYRCPRYIGKNHLAYAKWWKDFFDKHAGEYWIVHGHIGSTASIYLGIAKYYGLFTIAHSHNTDGAFSIYAVLYKLLSYRTRSIADFFFACSVQAGIDRFGVRITKQKDRYRVLNNAIDTTAFAFNGMVRKQMRDGLSLTNGDYVLGHVGRFMEQKKHGFIIDVFSEIVKREPNAKLLLVGDGPLRKQIEDKATVLGLEDRVVFTGIRSDVAELMQAMDVLVFPSKNEGLPVTLVEAQTSGLPCVISDSIPRDAVITKNLVTTLSLQDSPTKWAEHVLSRKQEIRYDHSEEVKAAGFDIHETAKWLEEFYLDKAKQ